MRRQGQLQWDEGFLYNQQRTEGSGGGQCLGRQIRTALPPFPVFVPTSEMLFEAHGPQLLHGAMSQQVGPGPWRHECLSAFQELDKPTREKSLAVLDQLPEDGLGSVTAAATIPRHHHTPLELDAVLAHLVLK
jgi:hypothetical protein